MEDQPAPSRGLDRRGRADLGSRLAGGPAPGRLKVSSGLADRHPAERSAHPPDLARSLAWCRGNGARHGLGLESSRRTADPGRRCALAADGGNRPVGGSSVLGPSIRARSLVGHRRGLLFLAAAGHGCGLRRHGQSHRPTRARLAHCALVCRADLDTSRLVAGWTRPSFRHDGGRTAGHRARPRGRASVA